MQRAALSPSFSLGPKHQAALGILGWHLLSLEVSWWLCRG